MLTSKKYKRDNFGKAKKDRTTTLFKKAYELSSIFMHNANQSGRVAVLVEHNKKWQAFLSNEDINWPIRFEQLPNMDIKYVRHIRTEEESHRDYKIQQAAAHGDKLAQDDDDSSLSDADIAEDRPQRTTPDAAQPRVETAQMGLRSTLALPSNELARNMPVSQLSHSANPRKSWRVAQRLTSPEVTSQTTSPPSQLYMTPTPQQAFDHSSPGQFSTPAAARTSQSVARTAPDGSDPSPGRIAKRPFFRRSTRTRKAGMTGQ